MNVSTSLNKKYIPYTIVMLTSICENNPCHVDAYLLSAELEKSDYDKISRALEDYDIDIHPVRMEMALFSDKLPRNTNWTVEMYFRLLMWDMLPKAVDRILYLDVDIIVNADIQEMYSQDFEGAELVVCQDGCGVTTWDEYSEIQRKMLAPMAESGGKYFNSGVILANIEMLRGKYPFQLYLDAMEAWNYEMFAPDQDILNYVHWRHLKYQDPLKYNCFSHYLRARGISVEQANKTASIIHFMAYKPWNTRYEHYSIEQIWWKYAKKTKIYHELLESFVDDAMSDFSLEKRRDKMMAENKELTECNRELRASLEKAQAALDEMAMINKQLINYVEQLTGGTQ